MAPCPPLETVVWHDLFLGRPRSRRYPKFNIRRDIPGYSRSTLYLRISQGLWTHPVKIGPRAVGWPDHEVTALNFARIAGKSDEEIRALVKRLEAARKNTQALGEA